MKNLYSFFTVVVAILAYSTTIAAPGDTLKVYSHDETHWSWANNYLDTVQFPTSDNYQKIVMHYVLGCPTGGCSEWDYKTNIEVWDPITDSTFERFELARVITPYAGNKNYGWFHEYTFDVTDYAPLLTNGEKIINAYYGGYQDGFTITVWFDFIEGTPPRRVLSVDQVYRSGTGGYRYGFASDPIEDHLTNKTFALFPNTDQAKFRMVATGHGFGNDGGNPENCAEFCDKYFNVLVDNTQRYQSLVWKDDCAADAISAQTGTWIYSRAGWCPGSAAQIFDHDLSPYISGNQVEINVNWENYVYTSGSSFDPHYWIEAQLFQYAEPAHQNDADLEKILSPSTDDRYGKFNPSCGQAIVQVKNQGSNSITSLKFEYKSQEEHVLDYTWEGEILPFQSQEITLPVDHIYFYGGSGDNTFNVEIIEVNGQEDENPSNNSNSSIFETPDVLPSYFICRLRTNNSPNENQLTITNAISGDTIVYRNNLTASTSYDDTLDLEAGCYKIRITDSGSDGLSWWANTAQGSGSLQLMNLGLNTSDPYFIQTLPADFGSFHEFYFTVDYVMGTRIISKEKDAVLLYPNPANNEVNVEISTIEGGKYDIQILSADGKIVFQKNQPINNIQTIKISTSELSSGVYFVKVNSSKTSHTKTLIIE